MTTLQSIIKTLAYRKISVLISLHTLTPLTSGGKWYNEDISEDDFLNAVDILTSKLCSDDYWNIIGLDLKNEPFECTWGTGKVNDWSVGSKLIAERMLKGCPNWLAFVEGIFANGHIIAIGNNTFTYSDWWGGGLQDVANSPLTLSTANKLVWAPHYYTTAVAPQNYLYNGGTKYIELSDAELRTRVQATMTDMFGYLAQKNEAILLGEFGGLYATDAHPLKTTQRTTDFTIEVIRKNGYSGGYVWSLNPESAYQYNPASTKGEFTEGLVLDDWLSPNKVFLKGMEQLNSLSNLREFPCFQDTT